jgi:hypothetical protein
MKKHKDMDWELFEMLEGELTPEQEQDLLNKMKSDSSLTTDWEFMQMTQLDAPDVQYQGKSKLLKKDTTLIVFSTLQWKRIAGIAALLALSFPIWNYFKPQTDSVNELAGSASELIKQPEIKTTAPAVVDIEAKEDVPVQSTVSSVPKSTIRSIQPVQTISKPTPSLADKITREALVDISPKNSNWNIETQTSEFVAVPKAKMQYNMASLIPREEPNKAYKGIRPSINAGLSLLVSPFRESKIKVKPTDKKTIQIVYSSSQYNASAMVSLKPLK